VRVLADSEPRFTTVPEPLAMGVEPNHFARALTALDGARAALRSACEQMAVAAEVLAGQLDQAVAMQDARARLARHDWSGRQVPTAQLGRAA
jgi:hypothetical protein